jgi:hypothetical protein
VQPDSDPVVLSSGTAQRAVGREQAKWEKAKREKAKRDAHARQARGYMGMFVRARETLHAHADALQCTAVGAHPSVHSLTTTLIPPGTADTYAFRQSRIIRARVSCTLGQPTLRAVRRVSIGWAALTGRLAAQLTPKAQHTLHRKHARRERRRKAQWAAQ